LRTIISTNGMEIFVSDDKFELASKRKWYASNRGHTYYAVSTDRNRIYLHQYLTDYEQTDHINGNGLDCRDENMRECTGSQNLANRRKQSGRTSKFKGVTWNKYHNKWRVRVTRRWVTIHIGYFDDEIEAAKAYDIAAREHFGEFAKTNF